MAAGKVIDAIRGLERERFRAMVDGDGPSLDALLSDNVIYVHTNGKRETKQQFIDAITAGRRRYRQIEIQSQDVLPVGRDRHVFGLWMVEERVFQREQQHQLENEHEHDVASEGGAAGPAQEPRA